jgi:hypothetical protein
VLVKFNVLLSQTGLLLLAVKVIAEVWAVIVADPETVPVQLASLTEVNV